MAHHARLSATLALAVSFSSLVLPAAAEFSKGHVHLPFTRVGKGPRSFKRDENSPSASIPLQESDYAFAVEVQVGTPPQKMSLAISTTTGSSWLLDERTTYCQASSQYIYPNGDFTADPILVDLPSRCKFGSFNKTLSSTYQEANQRYTEFSVAGIDGYGVYGGNMTDKLVLGSLDLGDVPLGLVTGSSSYLPLSGYSGGVLGLGFHSTVYGSSFSSDYYAPSILDRLVHDGHAVTRAFSIWLDDAQAKSGNLLFGAIDESAYDGQLLRVKAFDQYAFPGTFGVTIDGFSSATDASSEKEPLTSNVFPLGVSIGPGELLSYLPSAIHSKLVDMTGAIYNASQDITLISCDAASANNAHFTLRLAGPDGPELNFGTADLVIPRDLYLPYYLQRDTSETMCAFGVQRTDDYYSNSYSHIGSSLLRQSYLAFDLENAELAVARVRSSNGEKPSPTIVAFASSGAPIPSSSLYCEDATCQGDSAVPTSSSDPRYDYPDGTGSGSGRGSGSGYSPGSSEAGYWRNVTIGVCVGLGIPALVAGIALTIIWGRICRGAAFPADKDVEDDGSRDVSPGPVMSTAGSTGMRMEAPPVMLPPPGSLPVIREEAGSRPGAPQLPVVPTTGAITPPEPLTPSNRDGNGDGVSAVSAEDALATSSVAPVVSESAPPRSPKGKGLDLAGDRAASN